MTKIVRASLGLPTLRAGSQFQNPKPVLVIWYWSLGFVCNVVLGAWDLIGTITPILQYSKTARARILCLFRDDKDRAGYILGHVFPHMGREQPLILGCATQNYEIEILGQSNNLFHGVTLFDYFLEFEFMNVGQFSNPL
jgi:hypothetical protein